MQFLTLSEKLTRILQCLFRILGETVISQIGPATENGVDSAPMQQALFTFTDRGTQLMQEIIIYSDLMLKLADIDGNLKVNGNFIIVFDPFTHLVLLMVISFICFWLRQ